MNPIPKALLIKALRSGQYHQKKGSLTSVPAADKNNFCLLTLMRHVYCQETGQPIPRSVEDATNVIKWYGIPLTTIMTINGITAPLYDHNDEYNVTFEQFANALEQTP